MTNTTYMERMEAKLKGFVLAERERNYHDDSDFYAVFWNEAEQKVDTVETGTTRLAGGMYSVPRDWYAGDEVREKARKWNRRRNLEAKKYHAKKEAEQVKVGRVVTVVAGRSKKIAMGERARVIKIEASPFKTYYRNGYNSPRAKDCQRVLVERESDGKRVWVDLMAGMKDRFEVASPDYPSVFALRTWARGNPDSYERAFAHPGMVVM